LIVLMARRRATCGVHHQHLLLLVEAIAAGLHGCRAAALRVSMMAVLLLLLLLLIAVMLLEVVLISWQLLPVLLRLI
jgi:hypothetical protein